MFFPTIRVGLAASVVKILVLSNTIVQTTIIDNDRDVIVDAARRRISDTGQPIPFGFIPIVMVVCWIIDGIEANHPLIDIGPGMIHAVVVEPQEGLLLLVITTRRPVEIEVVAPLLRLVGAWFVDWVSVAFWCSMTIVQMRKERHVFSPKVLAIKVFRVLVKLVHESHTAWLSI